MNSGRMITNVNPTNPFDITIRDLTGLSFSGHMEAEYVLGDGVRDLYNLLEFNLSFDGNERRRHVVSPLHNKPSGDLS